MKTLDWLCLMLLSGNLAATRESVRPGERVTFRRYLRRRLPAGYAREIAARLRAREFSLWIDGRSVVDSDIVVERDSRVLLYVRVGNGVRIVEPDPELALN